MTASHPVRLRGAYAPVLTPFRHDLSVDVDRFVEHCRWLTDQGAGLAVFGTNSEAASVSLDERIELTEAVIEAGIDPAKLMPGTGLCALPEAVRLTSHAVSLGAPGVLVLPPYYFKSPSEDGLFAYYSEIIERVGDARLALYLYHFPQMSQVPITASLVERLLKRYPETIAGLKDSSGDWDNTRTMIERFASHPHGFSVFPASESTLGKAVPIGAAGCISATVNVNPRRVSALIEQLHANPRAEAATALQREVDDVRGIFQRLAMIPAMKATLARARHAEDWNVVRPPLQAFDRNAARDLDAQLERIGFAVAPLHA
ncbi:MAG: dihydrodipicolinate synthase family protein [Pseudomonadota bacterium]|jgi:4-hydroxy-tetrahydrodipicolinate synthase|uniref:dihydrodipicolinate synthase family protein n=1 Tax=Paraburkholderia TaxID=1822464 RepID=UPI000487183F|nr:MULTISPECIES: dihydrodipicolinate synthase family protein [Paraburkholderia]PNE56670.1 dihydrodipicolinate synthase family protein [Paraburkholderia fungorum]USU14503.1 dihydrodipicolinate synthase family protein [Paraburkholderia fungorum]USU22451.1 dihydrodipicolinate synthase family protein [Paraburkholderia fungorum]